MLQLATQEKKVEEQEKKAEQAQVGAQEQVAAAMAAISQGLLQRVRAGAVLSAIFKGALARQEAQKLTVCKGSVAPYRGAAGLALPSASGLAMRP